MTTDSCLGDVLLDFQMESVITNANDCLSWIQENKFTDTLLGKNKPDESKLKKVLLFIPRLLKAIQDLLNTLAKKLVFRIIALRKDVDLQLNAKAMEVLEEKGLIAFSQGRPYIVHTCDFNGIIKYINEAMDVLDKYVELFTNGDIVHCPDVTMPILRISSDEKCYDSISSALECLETIKKATDGMYKEIDVLSNFIGGVKYEHIRATLGEDEKNILYGNVGILQERLSSILHGIAIITEETQKTLDIIKEIIETNKAFDRNPIPAEA